MKLPVHLFAEVPLILWPKIYTIVSFSDITSALIILCTTNLEILLFCKCSSAREVRLTKSSLLMDFITLFCSRSSLNLGTPRKASECIALLGKNHLLLQSPFYCMKKFLG